MTELDLNPRRARIECILHQFLHHRCRSLDDLARGDLVGDPVVENADFGHA